MIVECYYYVNIRTLLYSTIEKKSDIDQIRDAVYGTDESVLIACTDATAGTAKCRCFCLLQCSDTRSISVQYKYRTKNPDCPKQERKCIPLKKTSKMKLLFDGGGSAGFDARLRDLTDNCMCGVLRWGRHSENTAVLNVIGQCSNG